EWGLVHLEMEEAGMPAFKGTELPNLDFAAFARACGAQGFTAKTPDEIEPMLRRLLATPGPALLDAFIDPDELPVLPHIKPEQVWKFGIAKMKEALLAATGG